MTRTLPLLALTLAISAPTAAGQDPLTAALGGRKPALTGKAEISAQISPKEAKRGEVVTYRITIEPKGGFWAYPVNPPNPMQTRSSFGFPVAANKGTPVEDVILVLAGPVTDPATAKWEIHDKNGMVSFVSYQPVTWELKAIVSPKTTPGEKTVKLDDIATQIQVCDERLCYNANSGDLPEVSFKVLEGDPVPISSEFQEAVAKATTPPAPPASKGLPVARGNPPPKTTNPAPAVPVA